MQLWMKKGEKVTHDHLHAFGAPCWYRIPKQTDKLLPMHRKGRMVGYGEGHGEYRVYDTVLKKVICSRDVVFSKSVLKDGPPVDVGDLVPAPMGPHEGPGEVDLADIMDVSSFEQEIEQLALQRVPEGPPPPAQQPEKPAGPAPPQAGRDQGPDAHGPGDAGERMDAPLAPAVPAQRPILVAALPNLAPVPEVPEPQPAVVPGRNGAVDLPEDRDERPAPRREDSVVSDGSQGQDGGTENSRSSSSPTSADSSSGRSPSPEAIALPPSPEGSDPGAADTTLDSQVSNDPLLLEPAFQVSASFAQCFPAVAALLGDAPKTYRQAEKRDDWKTVWLPAVQKELGLMKKHEVFKEVKREDWMKVLYGKWVMRLKEDGTAKARLVADGGRQTLGVDYTETHSQVVHKDVLRLIFGIINHLNLHAHTVDVNCAFLTGPITEKIFLLPPHGLVAKKGHVFQICRGLYGLHQSNRIFSKQLAAFLVSIGCVPLPSDPCVFTRTIGQNFLIISLHVDDELVASNDLPTLENFKAEFACQYAIKDNGPARIFLGIEVIRDREKRTLALSFQRFISDLLKDFGWDQLSPNKTPAPRITDSEVLSDEDHQNSLWFNYRRFVGSVQYLASNGRPDIIPAVSDLGRDLNKHGAAQIAKCKHLAKYLVGTLDLALVFEGGSTDMDVHADASWNSDRRTGRSNTGVTAKMLGGTVSWKGGLQKTPALSTLAAETMATSDAARTAIFLRRVFSEISDALPKGVLPPTPLPPMPIFNDNMGTIATGNNPVHHERTKHMDLRDLFIRDAVNKGQVTLSYIPTSQNRADILTKSLGSVLHPRGVAMLGLRSLSKENAGPFEQGPKMVGL